MLPQFIPLFLILLLIGSNAFAFPTDLMHKGQPINPSCINATQFGDSSRFEPKSVSCMDDEKSEADEYIKETNQQTKFDSNSNTVTFDSDYTIPGVTDNINQIHEEYKYVGSYKGKYIIVTSHYDTGGTGRFSELGIIERHGNHIKNAGEIAAGDRGWGGVIKVNSLQGNKLQYIQNASIDYVISSINDQSVDRSFPPFPSGVSLVYEVDLDSKMEATAYKSHLIGIEIDHDSFKSKPEFDNGDRVQYCFDNECHEYVKAGKLKLGLREANIFAEKVLKCIHK